MTILRLHALILVAAFFALVIASDISVYKHNKITKENYFRNCLEQQEQYYCDAAWGTAKSHLIH